MGYTAWMSFLSYNLITSITPGPMNIVAMNVAGNRGLKKSTPVLWGLTLGLAVVLLLCGLFSTAFARALPGVVQYMKYIGGAYMLWIARTILRSRPDQVDSNTPELTFSQAFLLQFINVKAYIWAITVYTAYVLPDYRGIVIIVAFAGLMLFIAVACALIWALAGSLLSRILNRYWQAANALMALLLLSSAVSLVVQG